MANDLKVVFKTNVQGIAKAGDVKKVSPGFARNYLFPRNLAFLASDSALKQWETVRQGTLSKAQRTRETAETLAQKVEAVACNISVKSSAQGRLFGSIGRQDIAEVLKKQGLSIAKSAVLLYQPIKQAGTSTVLVQVGAGVQAKLTVTVTPETNS